MSNERANGENDSNVVSEESESSGSQNEANQQQITLFKSFSRIAQIMVYSIGYWTISSIILNRISNRFFPEHNLIFKWNIYELIKHS